MAIVAGIDEAGFGPVLGPMVVSATAFQVPDEHVETSLWTLLAGCVGKRPAKRRFRVAINDSKKLYGGLRGPRGLVDLERGVLGMLSVLGGPAGTLREMLGRLSPAAVAQLATYPWYADADLPLPRCLSATDAALSANALAAGLERARVRLVEMRSECVFVAEYNRLVAATRNKSSVLFDVTCRLLARLAAKAGATPMRVHLDRHGGRTHYLRPLQRVFEGWQLKVIEESDALSAYRLTRDRQTIELHFAAGADERQLPSALASMVCKYLRECFMALLNRFWAGRIPAIAPTAGYYDDGSRFFRQIQPTVRAMGLDESLLYRSR